MAKYKINIMFKDDGKSLNEKLVEALKIEIQKKINYINTHYSQNEGVVKNNE